MSYIDLNLDSQEIKLAVTDNGDGTFSLKTIVTSGENNEESVQVVTKRLAGTPLSGQITLTNTSTAYQGGDIEGSNGFYIKSHPDNTKTVYVGNVDNTVTNLTGFPLTKSEIVLLPVTNLNQLYFYSTSSGQKICWIKA